MGFHLAGFVGAASTPRPDFLGHPVPDPLTTISDCLAEGLVSRKLSGWYDDAAAVPAGSEVLAIALAANDAADLATEFEDHPEFIRLISERRGLPDGSRRIGFEIVGVEAPDRVHSWHCHEYANLADTLGVSINDHGLLPSYYAADVVLGAMQQLPPEEEPDPAAHWTIVALANVPTA